MRTCVGIVPLVGVGKVGAEPGRVLVGSCTMNEKSPKTDLMILMTIDQYYIK
jgi:hypothetical protein